MIYIRLINGFRFADKNRSKEILEKPGKNEKSLVENLAKLLILLVGRLGIEPRTY